MCECVVCVLPPLCVTRSVDVPQRRGFLGLGGKRMCRLVCRLQHTPFPSDCGRVWRGRVVFFTVRVKLGGVVSFARGCDAQWAFVPRWRNRTTV